MSTHQSRLDALRKQLLKQGLDGFVVPISDEHMSEYVGAYAQRLRWLTGFDGSAGTAVILSDPGRNPAAAIFVDGRYTLQLREQVDERLFSFENIPETSVAKWLGTHCRDSDRIGYDPWLHGRRWVETAGRELKARNAELTAVKVNPIDIVWQDRPSPSMAPALVHDETLAGQTSAAKRAAIADWLRQRQIDAAVIPALDSIAWLLNIRGSDIERTPVVLAFVIAHCDATVDLFIAPEKVTQALRAHLGDAVRIAGTEMLLPALAALSGRKVAVDPDTCVEAIFAALEAAGAQIVEERDPCTLPKAIKNPVEQQGHRNAQTRDGAAMARFLHWLSIEAPKGGVCELEAAEKVHAFRAETGQLRDLSFDTISASGPNGAIVHYRVTQASNRILKPGSVYLVDSGGQYADGTTDLTRTVWIGPTPPPAEVSRAQRILFPIIGLIVCVLIVPDTLPLLGMLFFGNLLKESGVT
ncbi:MAG: aminopeptidase P family N-terminal domain-containing protein, partial [Novosphingobium sp.]|nr:aminopeptidase P family N-terminal domain-containing protein [Novosphingobium sp.]